MLVLFSFMPSVWNFRIYKEKDDTWNPLIALFFWGFLFCFSLQENPDHVLVGRDPPDFDPEDNKPLPRKLPKYESFAYYLGRDYKERLPDIQGKVDLLIIPAPQEVPISYLEFHLWRFT